MLAAASCFGIVAWFALVLKLGVIEEPKPPQAPMDNIKPMLLWSQVAIALFAGIALLFVAKGLVGSQETVEIPLHNEGNRYGRVSRILHWTTAILFIFMIPTGIFSSMIPEGVWYRTEYNVVHKTLGIIIFLLLYVRLFWNRRSKRPALDASLKASEKKMAHAAHLTLYFLLFAIPLSGYIMTSMHGYASYFFIFKLEPFLPESQAYIVFGLFHKYLLQYVVYIILGAHILGVLKHHYIDKNVGALKRMVG